MEIPVAFNKAQTPKNSAENTNVKRLAVATLSRTVGIWYPNRFTIDLDEIKAR